MLWLNIDASGSVAEAEVQKSSGYPELDSAAVRIARQMRFSPARNKGTPTAVWVAQRIQFNGSEPPNPRDNSGSSEDIELSKVGESQEPRQALSPAEAPVDLQELFRQTGVDPEEIESVEVVRGPAAEAIWGRRTDNGAIILETKRIDAAEKASWERSLEDERAERYRRFAKLSGVNPGELRSITIIKGPSAEAIWGGRPNTGVIILRARGD
jgi:TonB family protein